MKSYTDRPLFQKFLHNFNFIPVIPLRISLYQLQEYSPLNLQLCVRVSLLVYCCVSLVTVDVRFVCPESSLVGTVVEIESEGRRS